MVLVVVVVACGTGAPGEGSAVPAATTAATFVPMPTFAPSAPPATFAPTMQPAPTLLLPTGAPVASSEPDVQPTAGAEGSLLVTYRKTGGIAGVDEVLIVREGGAVQFTARGLSRDVVVAAADLVPLRRALASSAFADLHDRYSAMGADLFTYTITSALDGVQKTVVTMDGAQHPAVLGEVIALLEGLRARAIGSR